MAPRTTEVQQTAAPRPQSSGTGDPRGRGREGRRGGAAWAGSAQSRSPGLGRASGPLGLAAHSREQKRLRMLASQRAATAQIPAPVVPSCPSCSPPPQLQSQARQCDAPPREEPRALEDGPPSGSLIRIRLLCEEDPVLRHEKVSAVKRLPTPSSIGHTDLGSGAR